VIFTTGNRRRHRRGVFRYGHRHFGGPAPLRQLRELGAIEPQVRFFANDRGLALLVRKDNPFGIEASPTVARTGARIALPDAVEGACSRAHIAPASAS